MSMSLPKPTVRSVLRMAQRDASGAFVHSDPRMIRESLIASGVLTPGVTGGPSTLRGAVLRDDGSKWPVLRLRGDERSRPPAWQPAEGFRWIRGERDEDGAIERETRR